MPEYRVFYLPVSHVTREKKNIRFRNAIGVECSVLMKDVRSCRCFRPLAGGFFRRGTACVFRWRIASDGVDGVAFAVACFLLSCISLGSL